MFTLIVVAVYTVLMLIFVPLEKIGKWQTKTRAAWKKLKDKIEEE